MDDPEIMRKYSRHLTPITDPDYGKNFYRDMLSVVNDSELPEEFRREIKGELEEIREDVEALAMIYLNEEDVGDINEN
jgi:hypothetical protein